MEVTDVRLRRVNTDVRMKAICSITIDKEETKNGTEVKNTEEIHKQIAQKN